MDHRFQVFISSTFADLKEERQRVMQVIMEMDCIPAGMELFPAMDDDQLAFIKGVIDDCDYYVILIGGRYGSVNEQGVSYTEAEYDYAVAKVLKVVALLHAEPENIPSGKTESSDIGKKRLIAFREKVATGRLVRFWKSAEELPGLVALSLSKTIKAYPARGWVRGDTAASSDILAQLNQVRQENERLRNALQVELSRKAAFAKAAGLTRSNLPAKLLIPMAGMANEGRLGPNLRPGTKYLLSSALV